MREASHLVAALADLGYKTVEVHDTPQALRGYHGDKRSEKAHVIVRREFVGSASNDIGFVKGPDGVFNAIISDYDSCRHDDTWMNRLKQGYQEHRTIATAKIKGYILTGRSVVQGKVQLQFAAR